MADIFLEEVIGSDGLAKGHPSFIICITFLYKQSLLSFHLAQFGRPKSLSLGYLMRRSSVSCLLNKGFTNEVGDYFHKVWW